MTSRETRKPDRWTHGAAPRTRDIRRELIFRQAARCFNKHGYSGTHMEQIARGLRVSKAALYYYVRNKQEILFQCHQHVLRLGVEGIRHAERLEGGADVKLRAALAHFIEGVTGTLQSAVVLLEEGTLEASLVRRLAHGRAEYERRLRRLVEEGIASQVFVPCDPRLMVLAILGSVRWIPKWYSPGGERTPKELAEIFANYLVRGLLRSPSAPPGWAAGAPEPREDRAKRVDDEATACAPAASMAGRPDGRHRVPSAL